MAPDDMAITSSLKSVDSCIKPFKNGGRHFLLMNIFVNLENNIFTYLVEAG